MHGTCLGCIMTKINPLPLWSLFFNVRRYLKTKAVKDRWSSGRGVGRGMFYFT